LPGIEVRRLRPLFRCGDGGLIPQLFSQLKPFPVIHLHFPAYGAAEFAYLAARLRRQRYLVTYHMDSFGDTWLKSAMHRVYDGFWTRLIVGRADAIYGPSREYLRTTRAAPYLRWDRYADILHAGVDPERFRPRPKMDALVQKYGLAGRTVILFVGNLVAFKGLHLLIQAVAKIADPGVVLLVVGSGYSEAEYRRMVVDLKLGEHVVFAGSQPDDLLPHYYNLGDVFVLPSTHSESYGLVILEAMATGLPAVVSALPGPSQLIAEGENGLLFEVGSVQELTTKLAMLLCDPARRRQMGQAARQKAVASYSWDVMGAQLEHELLRLAAGAGGGPARP